MHPDQYDEVFAPPEEGERSIVKQEDKLPEITAKPQKELQIDPYKDISKSAFKQAEIDVILANVEDNEVEIRPDGLIYYPGIHYRNRLNKAFGPGAWALLPITSFVDADEMKVFYKGSLFIRGKFVSESIGEQKYIPNNPNTSYATAHEGAKTDCLTRCCKDLGIGAELWNPEFINRWKSEYAVQVWVENQKTHKRQQLWRKKDAEPFTWPYVEQGKDDKKKVTTTTKSTETTDSQKTSSGNGDYTITEKQRKRMYAIAKSKGLSDDDLKQFILGYKYEHSKDITKSDYDKMIAELEEIEEHTELQY